MGEIVLVGIAGAPGVAVGPAYLLDRRRAQVPREHIAEDGVAREIERFAKAQTTALAEIDDVRGRMEQLGTGEYVAILEAHRLMLRDPILIDGTRRRIESELINAEWALALTLKEVKTVFDSLTDDYFRERRSDVDFIGDRLQHALSGHESAGVIVANPGAVLVAHDLSPADAVRLREARVAAIALNVGGKTSHTVILARAFGLPAVVGLQRITDEIGRGDRIVVDGDAGRVIVHPSAESVATAEGKQRAARERARPRGRAPAGTVRTGDGVSVRLHANLEFAAEAQTAVRLGAQGIGLYRTEYLYMNRSDLQSEDEQAVAYTQVVASMRPGPVVLRTFDFGGDKYVSPVRMGAELAGAAGLRSIRYALQRPDIFKTQLGAMLRASAAGEVAILLPMIGSLEELRRARALIAEARSEVVALGHAVADNVRVGAMIELPSAVLLVREIVREVDFISVGTNDLIQYTLGVSRVVEQDAGLYEPRHPAIVRSLGLIARASVEAAVPASICGEMAADPEFTGVLVGLGFRTLSMNPIALFGVRNAIRKLKAARCEAVAKTIEAAASVEEIRTAIAGLNRECDVDVHG